MKPTMLNLICVSVSLIVLVMVFTGKSDAKVKETLVGAWLFDGNAKDASGNGKDGTLENGPKWAAGKFGQALEFNGGKKSCKRWEFRFERTGDISFLGQTS